MFENAKNQLFIAMSKVNGRIVIQLLLLLLILVAVLFAPETALANPSWGGATG